jgi:hypothetical protein
MRFSFRACPERSRRALHLVAFTFLVLALGSCSASNIHEPLLMGVGTSGNKIYFSGNHKSIWNFLKDYSGTYDIATSEGQIDYLLARLQTTKFKLERNNAPHTPGEAAQFLRWKMKRPRFQGRVNSARDFVDIICAGSVTSGKPYTAILPDGSRQNLEYIFSNELYLLEEFQQNRLQTASHESQTQNPESKT